MSQDSEFSRAQQIRRQMSAIRRELTEDVGQVERSARTLTNWRYYTTNYPWACVGVAAALGYLVVPRKVEIHTPDPKTLEKLAKRKHLVIEQKPKAEAKSGLVGAAFSFISGLVLKTAMAQLGNQLASAIDTRSPNNQSLDKRARPKPTFSPISHRNNPAGETRDS